MLDDEKPNEVASEPIYIPEEPTFPVDRRGKSEEEVPKIKIKFILRFLKAILLKGIKSTRF